MASPPNFVVMLTHDLGRHLGCYGVETVQSPRLDALAAESVLFRNCFCTAPQCSPSRAAITTGRWPHANGVMGLAHAPFNWRLNEGERPLPAALADAGYRTALAGIQHVQADPATLGFQEVGRRGVVQAEGVARQAAEVLATHDGRRPLYLEVGFGEPHRPFDAHGNRPDAEKGVWVPPYLPDCPEAREEFALLQGLIRRLDAGVGLVLDALAASPLRGETVVAFLTDHGLAMPRAKCTLYDPGLETAFMLRLPGQAGAVNEELSSSLDFTPTVLELAGLPRAANLHGASLVPLLRGASRAARGEIFAELTFHGGYAPMRAVRTSRWKLIRSFEHYLPYNVPADIRRGGTWRRLLPEVPTHAAEVELYDLAADRWEQNNLAEAPEQQAVLADLSARLLRWMEETGDPLLAGPIASPFYRRSMELLRAAAARGGRKPDR